MPQAVLILVQVGWWSAFVDSDNRANLISIPTGTKLGKNQSNMNERASELSIWINNMKASERANNYIRFILNERASIKLSA